MTDFEVRRLAEPLGAEIVGLDLREPLDRATVGALENAWHEHIVLLFRGQDLSPADQIRFAEYFGPPSQRTLPQERTPEGERSDRRIAEVTNIRRPGEETVHLNDHDMWFHHDGCFNAAPYKGTLLYGVEIPSVGGHTIITNMYLAFDRLADDIKRRIEGLRVLQVYDFGMRGRASAEMDLSAIRHQSQPIVVRHPVTGRRALYVSPLMTARIEGLPEDESESLLETLFGFTDDRAIAYEHVWRPGDLIIMDNWCSCHARTDFPDDERRLLRRSMVSGRPLTA